MSKELFSQDQIDELIMNRYVKTVSSKAITYTDEFKLHFIAEYEKGIPCSAIFEEAGFDIDALGEHRIHNASWRWRKSFMDNGVLGLQDTRRGNSGRPRASEMTPDEVIIRQKAEIEYLKAEVELLKKLELAERKVIKGRLQPAHTFGIIESIVKYHNLKSMISYLCKSAGVSRSGYYRFISTKELRKERHQKDIKDMKLIEQAYHLNKYDKGSRGIYMTLRNELEVRMNRKKIQRLMRKFGLVCPIRAANPYKRIAKATKEHRTVSNLLNRNFKDGRPGQILLTDITYIPFNGSFAYLSVIKDSVTNEVMAHNLSKYIKLDIATKTIKLLVMKHGNSLNTMAYIHSDQGVHYTHPKFQNILKEFNLGQSMSRKGNCWDNAPMESFFGHMKDELDFNKCTTFEELEFMIDEYMHYYNNKRYQWNLKKLTPVMYKNQLLAA
jgi:transposase InsO family protein